ncbi:oxygenase [Lithospermum erythrorhizon]|uniref:Oxygenase n=1 Tax=Lithospermum erythrorhizon TaxID=34254 RepID=A0AAV3RHX4_LITER
MFKLGTVPHATIARWKEKYGPVIWLKLGSNNTLVILSASASEELFKNHDVSFGDRMLVETMKSHDYHKSSMALAPYGPHWRMLRRLCSMEMFAHTKINETMPVRRKCIDDMMSWIEKEVDRSGMIQIDHFLFAASFNIFGNLILSRDLVEPDSKTATEFFKSMSRFTYWCSSPNLADLIGWLKPFDPQGLRRNADRDMAKLLDIVSGFIKERMEEKQEDKESKGADEPEKLSEHNISVFILEMFMAGGETTSNSTEWAMSELLRHPDKLMNAKAEIHKMCNKRHYLHGLLLPKNTQVLVNAWAIGRDPERWDEPLSFKPERFLGSNVDYRGQHFELIPFGAGRRMCVGLPLGHRMLHLVLGSLLHEFDWKLEEHADRNTIDMAERMGIAVRKLKPLRVCMSPRNKN